MSNEPHANVGIADRITRPAIQLAVLNAAGLVLAVAWQVTIAAYFGTTSDLDAFWIALALPKAITDAIHLGLLTILFILIFNLPQSDKSRAELTSSVLNAVVLGTLIVMPLMMMSAHLLTRWTGRGLDPRHQLEAERMLRVLVFILLPNCLAGAFAGILHAHQRFVPLALGRILSLFAQILLLYVLVTHAGLGADALIWSTLAGAVILFLCCVPGFLHIGFPYRPVLRWRGPEQRAIVDVALTMMAFLVLDRLNQVVDRFVASFLAPGSISALEYGWRFEIPIAHVLGMSVALPALAVMAGHAGERQWSELRATIAHSLQLMILLVMPVIGFVVVLREPLTFLWFERGAFSSASARLVSSLLPFMGVMFLMKALGTITVYGLLSMRKLRILLVALLAESAVNASLDALLFRPLGLPGIALASAIAMTFGNVWLGRVLLRELHDWPFASLAVQLRKPVAATVTSIVTLAVLFRLFGVGWIGGGHLANAIELGVIGLTFLLGHLLLANRMGLLELRFGGGRPRLLLRPGEAAAASAAPGVSDY